MICKNAYYSLLFRNLTSLTFREIFTTWNARASLIDTGEACIGEAT